MGVYDSELWKLLETKVDEEDNACQEGRRIGPEYLAGIKDVCNYGIERAALIRDTFPMYTKHDETHICNVLQIMWNLLDDKAQNLSRDEAAALVLAACCHDVGMSYSEDERGELLREDPDRLNKYLDEHPAEYVKAYGYGGDEPHMDDEMMRTYLRSIHHDRVADLLYAHGWPMALEGHVDAETIVEVCRSHGNDVATLDDLEPTNTIDLRLCAILLRLADILDFDTTRAPHVVYDYCGFDKKIDAEALKSKEEWDKHLSSHGFDFAYAGDRSHPYDLPYVATCRSMQVEQAVKSYLGWVDQELLNCGKAVRSLEDKWRGLVLPGQIKPKITPIGYVSGEYHLTLEQDKVVELLVGNDLYGDPSVFVRELLQNAIDAVRTRQQLDQDARRKRSWKPQISIHTWMDDEGYHWFRIEDNGIGMSEEIIRNHLLKVGSSYYSSDAFRREKIARGADSAYTPISRFGIGILSCFMGDKRAARVEISTKHFEGYAPALRLSMDGMSGYYYLAEKSSGHNPGPMRGITPNEKRAYRTEPGTVVAVRTNLYRSGIYGGFKEIVDKYVVYPEVPIHYEGEDGVCDYLTEREFMDAVYALNPSKDRENAGLFEYPIPEESLRKVQERFPNFTWDETPKIQVKVFALDQYSPSPYITGAVVLARVAGELPPFEACRGDETVFLEPKIRTLIQDQSLFIINLEIVTSGWLLKDYCPPFDLLRIENTDWQKVFFADLKEGASRDKCAHNGIRCGCINDFFGKMNKDGYRWVTTECITSFVLFKDKLRPVMGLSREEFIDMPVETRLLLEAIRNNFRAEGYTTGIPPLIGMREKRFFTVEELSAVLEANQGIVNSFFVNVDGEGQCNISRIRELLNDRDYLLIGDSDLRLSVYNHGRLNTVFALCCILQEFDIRHECRKDIHGSKLKICVCQKRTEASAAEYPLFPPAFFTEPMPGQETSREYLATWGGGRYSINAAHRFSKFLLENAELLNERLPGLFQEFIRSLSVDRGPELIKSINELLKRLRRFRGVAISVPDEVFLTEDDLV